jgi:hypothetical protein
VPDKLLAIADAHQANDLAEILSASKSSLTALPQGYIGLTRL